MVVEIAGYLGLGFIALCAILGAFVVIMELLED